MLKRSRATTPAAARPGLRLSGSARVAGLSLVALIAPVVGATGPQRGSDVPVVIAGEVVVDGVAQSRAVVQALVWPAADRLVGLASGRQVPRRVVTSTRTDARGRFALRLLPSSLPPDAVDASGGLNLDVVTTTATRQLVWSVPVRREAGRWRSASGTSAHSVMGVPDLMVDLGRSPGVADRNDPPSEWSGADGTTLTAAGLLPAQARPVTNAERAQVESSPDVPATGCVATALSSFYDADESFAAVYAWSGGKATVYQATGTSHVLGIGVKGGSGTWSGGGTVTFKETYGAGASVPGVADAYAHNSVQYRDYYYSFPCQYTQRRPYSTQGLLDAFTYAPHVNFTHCLSMVKGGSYWKDQGTALTVAAGTDIGPISVSAQSGWNSATKLTWVLTSASHGCGSTTGWASAPQMDVRQ